MGKQNEKTTGEKLTGPKGSKVSPKSAASGPQKPTLASGASTKEEKARDAKYDQFIIEKVFPSPESLLATVYPPLQELIESGLFVLDANTLLAPFLVGKDSLQDVAKVFKQLVKANRLLLPSQAIREYARHRGSKIAEAWGHVQQRMSDIPPYPKQMEISMFEEMPQYKGAVESADKVKAAIKEYKAKLQALKDEVSDWNSNDPVTKLYAGLFSAKHIIDHDKTHDELSADLAHRVLHEIPPGFKDKSKQDGGIGDLAIWHTILKLGRDQKRHVVFVTNDGKSDWMVRHGDEPLYPRFELVEEFRRSTGMDFAILRFARFLRCMGAETKTVEEIASSSVSHLGESEFYSCDLLNSCIHKLVSFFERASDPNFDFIFDDRFPLLVENFESVSKELAQELESLPADVDTQESYARIRDGVIGRLKLASDAHREVRVATTAPERFDAGLRFRRRAEQVLSAIATFSSFLRRIG